MTIDTPEASNPVNATPIRTILVPTAFSDLSRHAARYAKALATALHAKIIVVHAVEPAPPAAEVSAVAPVIPMNTDVNLLLDNARKGVDLFIQENLQVVPTEARVTIGVPDHEIVEAAVREHADLIVMGTHARGMLKRLVYGSISKSVLESSPCPVLLVPLKEQ